MIMLEGSGCYLNLLFQQAVTWFRFGTDSCLVWGPLVLKTDKPLEHLCYPGLLGSPGAPGASAHLCMYCLMGRKELLEARPPIPLRDQGVGHGHLRPIETIRFPSCPLVVGSPWSAPQPSSKSELPSLFGKHYYFFFLTRALYFPRKIRFFKLQISLVS